MHLPVGGDWSVQSRSVVGRPVAAQPEDNNRWLFGGRSLPEGTNPGKPPIPEGFALPGSRQPRPTRRRVVSIAPRNGASAGGSRPVSGQRCVEKTSLSAGAKCSSGAVGYAGSNEGVSHSSTNRAAKSYQRA